MRLMINDQRGAASLAGFAVLLLMVAGIGIAMVASQRVQDTRSRASFSNQQSTVQRLASPASSATGSTIVVNSVRVVKQNPQNTNPAILLPGESINFIANISNTSGEVATSSAAWKIEPTSRSNLLDWSGESLFQVGTKDYTVNRILPVNIPFGTYTFTVSQTSNGQVSQKSVQFVVGSSTNSDSSPVPEFNDQR